MTLMMSSMVRAGMTHYGTEWTTFSGGAGKDILTGGDGMDQFWITSNALPKEADTITDLRN